MKILLYACLRTRKSLLNFGRNLAPNPDSGLVIRTALALAKVCAVVIEVFNVSACVTVGRCQPAPLVPNATVPHFNPSARTLIVSCLPGFRFSNGLANKQMTCSPDSSWTVPEPCKRKLTQLDLSPSSVLYTLFYAIWWWVRIINARSTLLLTYIVSSCLSNWCFNVGDCIDPLAFVGWRSYAASLLSCSVPMCMFVYTVCICYTGLSAIFLHLIWTLEGKRLGRLQWNLAGSAVLGRLKKIGPMSLRCLATGKFEMVARRHTRLMELSSKTQKFCL